ncbi:hypothetical protein AAC387_Pa03g2188 [Persea americana]
MPKKQIAESTKTFVCDSIIIQLATKARSKKPSYKLCCATLVRERRDGRGTLVGGEYSDARERYEMENLRGSLKFPSS